MCQIEKLIQAGFHEIVFVNQVEKEDVGGYNNEYIHATYVARKDSQPVRVTIHQKDTFFPKRATTFSISDPVVINESEYQEFLSAKGSVIDTPEFFEKRHQEQEARELKEKEKDETIPQCPECSCKMTIRRRKKDRVLFWGCSKFPDCTGTRSISSGEVPKLKRLGLI